MLLIELVFFGPTILGAFILVFPFFKGFKKGFYSHVGILLVRLYKVRHEKTLIQIKYLVEG